MLKIKNMVKLEIIVIITEGHRGTAHRISDLKHNIPKENSVVFQNELNYNYNPFIMKEVAEEFKGQFSCLGENTEKNMTLSVLVEKEIKIIDQNGT